ncbi:MAG: hypothetical protein BAJALOKI3v1_800005 [Promethearchaeota archaeon]|jgi:hypothetical protein|nr:MAG: hypothetical protein BAJALOKI3v1_800005 [Candidatus Lokiarchaeota archaeon]
MFSNEIETKDSVNLIESFNQIKVILSGLAQIFELNYSEDDFFHEVAKDNLIILEKNIPKILSDSRNRSEIINHLKKVDLVKVNQDRQKNLSLNP